MYIPESVPQDVTEIPAYLQREFQKISNEFVFTTAHLVEVLYVAPAKPREGMIVLADGTSWNPGGGKGIYAYYSGAWNKL